MDDKAATFRIKDGQIEPVMNVQKLRVAFPGNACAAAFHPTGDPFLFGGKVFDFATGQELLSLSRPSIIFSRNNAQRSSGA